MAIKREDRSNFKTLCKAAKEGNLALMECTDAASGEYRAVICAVNYDGEYEFIPLGHMATDNPYTQYTPPV